MQVDGYLLEIVRGAWLTLALAVASLVVASALGLAAALAKLSRRWALVVAANLYSTVIRGIPDLVLMLLIFYGGQSIANQLAQALGFEQGVDVNPFIAGVLTIGFIYGAYLSETFRGAFIAIAHGQSEAALAFGMSRTTLLIRILLPQMVRLALPGFTNNWLVMIKATALVSIIGLSDMMYRAKQASGATRSAFLYFVVTALIYLVITTLSLWLLRRLERHLSAGILRADF
jgi:arginine/ornithine transport system permease protein